MRNMSRPNGDLSPITLRIADACRITGIGRSKFYELIKAGEIEVTKIGTITLVPMSGIQSLLARGRPHSTASAPCKLAEAMHPFLASAVMTASIAATSASTRRDLSSEDEGTRMKAEDSMVQRMVAALYELDDRTVHAA